MAWAYEDIHIPSVGMIRLTGDTRRVLASMPGLDDLVWAGIPFRVHASWTLVDGALGGSDAWMLGKGRQGGLSDSQATDVRDYLEDCIGEWVADPQSSSMLADNANQVVLSAQEIEVMRSRMQRLQAEADGTDPYATMDALREAAVIASRLRSNDNPLASPMSQD